MLTEEEFSNWCKHLQLSQATKEVILQIRNSPPNRRVRSSKKNVSGRYPSKKMGVIIQFESHKNEMAAIVEFEYDENILEFYDQPNPSIKLHYKSKKGRQLNVIHTPDFFVIGKSFAGWIECKTEEDLIRLSEKQPFRYCRDENGNWHCPPGESYAAEYGLIYSVRSSSENNRISLRNMEFLEDYLRSDKKISTIEIKNHIFSIVKIKPGITLEQLAGEILNIDSIYEMIATRDLYVDLSIASLTEPNKINLFLDRDQFLKFNLVKQVSPLVSEYNLSSFNFFSGEKIIWDGILWTIANLGVNQVALIQDSGTLSLIPINLFRQLLDKGIIKKLDAISLQNAKEPSQILLETASPKDLEEANRRLEIIKEYLKGEPIESFNESRRLIFYWLAAYRVAEMQYNNGLVGLLPKHSKRGNRNKRLPVDSLNIMNQVIEENYETLKQKPMFEVYGTLVSKCESLKIIIPSYKTFTIQVKNRPQYEQTLKRRGSKAAYQIESFFYELEQNTPRHGDRPFHICHLDHTKLDIELICSTTHQNLGRPWLSLMTDAFSRKILAAFITYDAPSYRSVMMTIRECVRRFGRLPQILVVDGGKEFESIYFELLLARYECIKKTRPAAKPRFGSVIERLFGTNNTRFINNLAGNTQMTKYMRQVTKSVNPKELAVWTLGLLYEHLCQWLYEVYDTVQHPTLGQCPRDAFTSGLIKYGYRNYQSITYNQEFRTLTLPSTPKGTAKILPGKGVKINNIYYWNNAFRNPAREQKQVPIRYDPYDIGTAYAYIGNQWVSCISDYYTILHGRSERELMILSNELKKHFHQHSKQFTITAKKIADFLATTEADEALLSQQLKDKEAKVVLKIIEYGSSKDNTSEIKFDERNDKNLVDEEPIDYDSFTKFEKY